MFALAAGVSEYYDNRRYVAGPVYSLALLDGFGRMGNNAHWFSDVVGAAVLGAELFIYLHKRHDQETQSVANFPRLRTAWPVKSKRHFIHRWTRCELFLVID